MAKAKTTGEGPVDIKLPEQKVLIVDIVGTAPLVLHRFSTKARQLMRERQEAGGAARKKVREPKNFNQVYEDAKYVSRQGWCGIPAAAFRSAMIDSIRTLNTSITMTQAKLVLGFVEADGYERDDGTPLVRIYGDPHPYEAVLRNDNGSADLRMRPMGDAGEWRCTLRVPYNAQALTEEAVATMLAAAGRSVGVGEGRPFSSASYGCGFGLFALAETKKKGRRG